MKRIVPPLFWLILWELIALLVNNSLIFAGPAQTAAAAIKLFATDLFWISSAATILEIFASFVAAFVLGISFGLLGASISWAASLMHPFVAGCKSIPVACITVIFMLFAGPFFLVFAVVFLLVFPAYYTTTKEAYELYGTQTMQQLERMGLSGSQILFAFLAPHLLAYIRTTSKSVVGMSWKAAIAAQVIGLVGYGLGDMVYRSKVLLEIPELFALTALIVIFSLLAERAFFLMLLALRAFCEKRAVRAKKLHLVREPEGLTMPEPPEHVSHIKQAKLLPKTVFPRECALLIGKTGAGKTSIFKKTIEETPLYVGYLSQEGLYAPDLRAQEMLSLFCEENEALAMLSSLGLEKRKDAFVRELSGGEKRLVELAFVLLSHTQALVLDEPFQGMDEKTRSLAIENILRYANKRPVIISAHSKADAQALSANVLVID